MTTDADGRDTTLIRCGDLTIDRDRYGVTVGSRPVPLTYMEFRLLVELGRGAGRVLSYNELERAFWGQSSAQTRRRLAVLVARIRSKLGDGARHLDTVHRVGYRLLARDG